MEDIKPWLSDPFPVHRVIGNNGILRKKTRIAIVNEYSLVECMDRIILMQNRDHT